jgi:hypothetical protein
MAKRKIKKQKNDFRQGVYTVKNTQKYMGSKPPIFRSSWEFSYMRKLDYDSNVKKWCSECAVVPYSFNGKVHKYFTDFMVIYEDDTKELIEIKPHRETQKPRKTKTKSQKTMIYEHYTYLKNQAKWEAATEFCKKRNMVFKIITEKQLFV